MRRAILIILSTVSLPVAARAQQDVQLPPINVRAPAQQNATATDRCVDVQIGGSWAFDCINFGLRQRVDRINPSMNILPVDARSSDIHVGAVNMPAGQQQYERNFGVSVIPYRPAPPTFSAPLGGR